MRDLRKDYLKTSVLSWLFSFLSLSQMMVAGIEKSLDFYQESICPDKGLCK